MLTGCNARWCITLSGSLPQRGPLRVAAPTLFSSSVRSSQGTVSFSCCLIITTCIVYDHIAMVNVQPTVHSLYSRIAA